MLCKNIPARSRLGACLLLTVALAACSRTEPSAPVPAAAPATGSETAAAPAAAEPTSPPATVVAANVQAMGVDQLREGAAKALRENRMYAPAGDNAMEYYLALRDKLPDDASVKSALTDLQPYTLIAAEQSLNREDFTEAERLVALIEKVDATAPALPRLKQGITNAMQVAAKRTVDEADRAKKDAETRAKQQVEQQRLAQQQAAEATAAKELAERQEAARKESERQGAERQAAAKREADARTAAAQQAAASAPKPAAG